MPNLNVKPRSSVFRYKGTETSPQTIGKELNVQAILIGRVAQRGQDLSLFVELIDRTLALDPNFYVTRYYLGMAYHAKELYAEAIAEYRKALALNDDPWVKAQLARSLARSGQRNEAVKLLRELESESARRYVSSASLALAHGALGEKDKAFALLGYKADCLREGTPCPVSAI